MRTLLCILLFFTAPLQTWSQTPVVELVQTLDSLSLLSIDHWKVSPDLRTGIVGDPTREDFDDSRWEELNLDESIYLDSCWIRKEFSLPARILGAPVTGLVRFLVSVDDYGYLWVNGESRGYFPWNGEFLLTQDAKPGVRFVLAIKAINTGGPLRLIRASCESEQARPSYDLLRELSLGLRAAQKLLSFDTYQTNSHRKIDPKTDRSKSDRDEKVRLNNLLQNSAAQFDVETLANGNLESLRASVDALRTKLAPVTRFCKRFKLHLVSNAHIDAAWLWRQGETVEVCRNTFTSVLDMMDQRPDFTYAQSSAAYYRWMEEQYPAVFDRIRFRVQDGRWEVVGGMWVEPDCNLPSGESWSRHLLYANRYFKKKLGTTVRIGWNPDSFGYTWSMPQIYRQAGIDVFITQKIGWSERNVFPHRVFWWQSPDGSRILTYFPYDYVNELTNPFQLIDWLRQFEANTGLTSMMVLFGVGDHGGGPTNEMLDRVEKLKKLDLYPTVEYGTVGGYMHGLEQGELGSLPVWNDELYLEYHQGTFTTQAAMKQFNRRNEASLVNAEKVSTIGTTFGRPYGSEAMQEAWEMLLFNQFHDILPGSGIREVYVDARESHENAGRIGKEEMDAALEILAGNVSTSILAGEPIVVFNPLSWERTDIVEIDLPGEGPDYAVFDEDDREMPSQIIQGDRYSRKIIFVARNIPPLGYRVYALGTNPGIYRSSLRIDNTGVENDQIRVSVNPRTGWINSVLRKKPGREFIEGEANRIQVLEDKPQAWDAWNIGLTGNEYPTALRKIEIIETGPVRAILRVHRDYRKPGTSAAFPTENYPSSFFSQDIILYDGLDQVFFVTNVDWWEEKTMLKVAFPVAVKSSVASYEIPFGFIERSTEMKDTWDSAKVEVPAHRWVDISHGGFGVSLLNKAKYGHDIKGNVIRLSMLRSPNWPDPTADRGKHVIEYSMYPHEGGWEEAGTLRRAYEYNNPLLVAKTTLHGGSLPLTHSFVSVSPGNVILASMKKAEDSDAWILVLYDSQNNATDAVVKLPRPPLSATVSNFLEEEVSPLPVVGNSVTVPIRARSVAVLKVSF